MPNIYKVFNLKDEFSLEELKSSYNNLLNKLNNKQMSDIDKEILTDRYKQLYKEAKHVYKQNQYYKLSKLDDDSESRIDLFDRFDRFDRFTGFDRFNNFLSPLNNFVDHFDRFDRFFDNLNVQNQQNQQNQSRPNVNMYSYSSSYKSTLNEDGSRTIIESKAENKNGEKNNIINAYKKMPNGEVVQFTEDEMKQLQNNNLNQLTN
jgi:hypothetical protein